MGSIAGNLPIGYISEDKYLIVPNIDNYASALNIYFTINVYYQCDSAWKVTFKKAISSFTYVPSC